MNRSRCGRLSGFGSGFLAICDHLPISRSIGQPLANNPPEDFVGTRSIVNSELDAVAIPEIELGHVAMQMLLGAVLPYCESRNHGRQKGDPDSGIGQLRLS